MISFGEVKCGKGKPVTGRAKAIIDQAKPGERSFCKTIQRLTGEGKFFGDRIVWDNEVCPTVVSGDTFYRASDKTLFSDEDFIRVQTFPRDYNFKKTSVQYVCGMSVPPNMTANIGVEIWKQWLSKK